MSSIEHVSDSEESEVDLLQTPSRKDNDGEASQPASVLSHRFRESPSKPVRTAQEREPEREPVVRDNKIAVMVSPPKRPWEYQPFCENNTVDTVLGEFEGPDALVWYEIEFEDGRKQDVSVICIASTLIRLLQQRPFCTAKQIPLYIAGKGRAKARMRLHSAAATTHGACEME
jgi:hypothetical protein